MSLSLPSVRRFPFPTDPDTRGDRRARRNALWLILNALLIKRKPWREDYWWVGIKGNRFTATTSAGHALPPKATHADLGCRQTGGVILHLRTCSRARCVRWSEVRLRRGVLGLDSGGTGPPSSACDALVSAAGLLASSPRSVPYWHGVPGVDAAPVAPGSPRGACGCRGCAAPHDPAAGPRPARGPGRVPRQARLALATELPTSARSCTNMFRSLRPICAP